MHRWKSSFVLLFSDYNQTFGSYQFMIYVLRLGIHWPEILEIQSRYILSRKETLFWIKLLYQTAVKVCSGVLYVLILHQGVSTKHSIVLIPKSTVKIVWFQPAF